MPSTLVIRANNSEPTRAFRKLVTSKPGTIHATSANNMALMINENRPSVSRFNGKANKDRMGRMKKLTSPITSAIKYFRSEFESGLHTPSWELFPPDRSTLFGAEVSA